MSLINLAFKFFASWNFILSSILLASLHVRKINSLRLFSVRVFFREKISSRAILGFTKIVR